jgi:hypothetical protein
MVPARTVTDVLASVQSTPLLVGGGFIELAVLFLVLALVAAVLGARGIAGLSMDVNHPTLLRSPATGSLAEEGGSALSYAEHGRGAGTDKQFPAAADGVPRVGLPDRCCIGESAPGFRSPSGRCRRASHGRYRGETGSTAGTFRWVRPGTARLGRTHRRHRGWLSPRAPVPRRAEPSR